jgi:hypothetical protein
MLQILTENTKLVKKVPKVLNFWKVKLKMAKKKVLLLITQFR